MTHRLPVPGGFDATFTGRDKTFGLGDQGIKIPEVKLQEYVGLLRDFFKAESGLEETKTLSKFETAVIALIHPHVLANTLLVEQEVRAFFAAQKDEPITEHHVFRPIFGIELPSATAPLALGPYTIYDTVAHADQIAALIGRTFEAAFFQQPFRYLIKVSVPSREPAKATELADARFEQFESVIRFMIGNDLERFEVSILNLRGVTRQNAYIFIESGATSSAASRRGMFESVPLNDAHFTSIDMGFDKVWNILRSPSQTELERRLILAINWIGQSYLDNAPATAFIKAAISLETLFTTQEKTVINASILSQISENVALLLGADVSSRFMIESEMKRLYAMRSAIAHHGRSKVEPSDVNAIRVASRLVTMKILTTPSLMSLRTIEEMYKSFKAMKFGCAAI